MKKILTTIFGSTNPFLKVGKIILLTVAVLENTFLSAQIIVPTEPSGTKVEVTRWDTSIDPLNHAYVPSSATLQFKSGSATETYTFLQGQHQTKNYTLPTLFTPPGQPPLVHTFKINFASPIGFASRYYPIPTTIGSSTTIVPGFLTSDMDPGLWYCAGPDTSYSYGVTLTRTSATTFILQCTKFSCLSCPLCPPSLTATKTSTTDQNKAKLYPNPSNGYSELEYTASGKETITVLVANITGKTLYGYKTDIESGLNKLPIDIQTAVSGTYYVNWRSSNGSSGVIPMIKK